MDRAKQYIKYIPNRTLFYASLFAVLILSYTSYFLSDIASGLSVVNSAKISDLTLFQYSAMGFFMLIAWKTSPKVTQVFDYKVLVYVAIVARVLLFDVQPYASNDVDRYLFDGRIVVEGLDPYRVSHDLPALKALRELWQPPQEHAKYVTIYPPLALAFFSLAASAGIDGALIVWKLILLSASLLTLWLTVKVLKKANKLQHIALVALSPLLILETGVGLHLDTLSTLAIIATIYFWQKHQIIITGVVIGLGMLTKILPIMLLLPLVFTQTRFLNAIKLTLATILTVISIYGLALYLGFHPVGSIGIFFEKWRFGSPLFVIFDHFLSGKQILITFCVIAVIVCSLVSYICWRNRVTLSKNTVLLIAIMQLLLTLPLVLSPVVFPWYLMPLVPLLALYPNKYLITWTLLMPLTYEVIGQFICCQIWQPAQWPIWLLGILQLTTLIMLLRYCTDRWSQLNKPSKYYVS